MSLRHHCYSQIFISQGGRHIDHVADQIVTKLIEVVKKKNKGGVNIKPFQVMKQAKVKYNVSNDQELAQSEPKSRLKMGKKHNYK